MRALLDGVDQFAIVQSGAHGAATSPWNRLRQPSAGELKAGAYTTGAVSWQGLAIAIENPALTVREGVGEDGKPWRNTMLAHYGFIDGTRGADGDEIDLFLGPAPESSAAWILNQRNAAGAFDEHKVLAGFIDARHAVDAYRLSYSDSWDRYAPPIPVTPSQLRWWLQFADTTREFSLDLVPPEPDMNDTSKPPLQRVFWDSAAEPTMGQTLAGVLYAIRVHDAADGLLLDPMSMADITEGAEVVALDALVTEAGKLKPKMTALMRVMEAAGGEVKPLAVQFSDLLRRFGGVHVAALFELSDGQTITAWFHNPDSTPNKFSPGDMLVSWKWQLNKKDVTIAVAPESGQDLNLREVARRLMRLATKNSAAFAKANAKRAGVMAEIAGLRETLASEQAVLADLHQQIEVATGERDAKAAAAASAEASRRAAEAAIKLEDVQQEGYEIGAAAGRAGSSFLAEDSPAFQAAATKYAGMPAVLGWLREGFNDGWSGGRLVRLQREADGASWGIGSPDYYGVLQEFDLPNDWMPETHNRQAAMDMGAMAKEFGRSIAVQILPNSDKPFRVVNVLYEDGRGVGSDWAATAQEAYAMVADAKPVQAAVEIPEGVRQALDRLLAPVRDLADSMERARQTDAKFGGAGRYGAEVWREMGGDQRLADEAEKVEKALAGIPGEANRAAAAGYIEANRAKPAMTEAEANYFAPQEVEPPAATESRTVRLPGGLTKAQAYVLFLVNGLKAAFRRKQAKAQGGMSEDEFDAALTSLKRMGALSTNGGMGPTGESLMTKIKLASFSDEDPKGLMSDRILSQFYGKFGEPTVSSYGVKPVIRYVGAEDPEEGAVGGAADPEPAQLPAEAQTLRDVLAGKFDTMPLADLLTKIEDAVKKLEADGLLQGAIDADASAAITHWVKLDELANG